MSAVRVFTPENRLAQILNSLTAPTTEEMATEAEQRLEGLTDTIAAFVAEKLSLILPLAEKDDDVLVAECRVLANSATQIAEVTAVAKLEAVGEIAHGIAVMVEGHMTSGVWHSEALRVHIRAMKLLTQAPGRPAHEEEDVLSKLHQMRLTLGLSE